jgi:hypothetical protein
MVTDADKTAYYANRSKYRYIKIENDQFTVYVYGHDKRQFDRLVDAVAHRDLINSKEKLKGFTQ